MADLNWKFLVKKFMETLQSEKSRPEGNKKKQKRKLSGTSQVKQPTFTNSVPRTQPSSAIGPSYLLPEQRDAFVQFEALRLQLLRQLVIYQKQLLALKMPVMVQPQMGQNPVWTWNAETTRIPTKLSPIVKKTMSHCVGNSCGSRAYYSWQQPLDTVGVMPSPPKRANKNRKTRKIKKRKAKPAQVMCDGAQTDTTNVVQNSGKCCSFYGDPFVVNGFGESFEKSEENNVINNWASERQSQENGKTSGLNATCIPEKKNIKPKRKLARNALPSRNNTKAGSYKMACCKEFPITTTVLPSHNEEYYKNAGFSA